jgi:hypothetical protein
MGDKVGIVMREFKHGRLRSSSGRKVKKRKQAVAIALSEERRAKKHGSSKRTWRGRTRVRPRQGTM